jgi:hypothetical protein
VGGAGEEGQIPLTVVFCCESEQGECKVSQEAVDIGLQEYPRRLRLITVEKRFSTMQGIEGRYEVRFVFQRL